MQKDVKEKLTKSGSSLYDREWIEKAADKGYNDFLQAANAANPVAKNIIEKNNFWFEILYYSAFESALNTFIFQMLEDAMTEVNLCLDEFHKVTATVKDKRSGRSHKTKR